jgi:predicted RecA/RadA family phage recombinase
MKNYVQEGKNLPYLVPSATTIASGQGVKVGLLFGVAIIGGTTGHTISLATEGVYDLPKAGSLAINIGDAVYWDDTNKRVNKTASGNLPVGIAVESVGSAATTVNVKLGGVPTIAA